MKLKCLKNEEDNCYRFKSEGCGLFLPSMLGMKNILRLQEIPGENEAWMYSYCVCAPKNSLTAANTKTWFKLYIFKKLVLYIVE